MQGKPAAPCPPANNTCKQGNGKSRKQRRQHRCHPRCTLAAMLVVTAPPAIALAPTPVARSQPCRQSQHHPRSHRPQPPLFALATPIKPSISHQTHAMTTLSRTPLTQCALTPVVRSLPIMHHLVQFAATSIDDVHTDLTRLQGTWWSPMHRRYLGCEMLISNIEAFVKLASGGDFCI